VHFAQDNGIYLLKNLHIAVTGGNVTAASYRFEQINHFRLEVFTTICRIGDEP